MNRDVTELLRTLRENNLAWMADEIAITIANGKVVGKTYKETRGGRTLKGTESIPFDDDEQVEIVITAIRSYMVDLEEAWDSANADFQTTIPLPGELPVKITILPPEGGTPIEPFGRDVPFHRRKLIELLIEAWPRGRQDFYKRFSREGA